MKWSKDYRTGEVVTEKAYKPDNLKGKATIQLKDAEGNIVQEVVSENIIVPPMQSIQNPYYEAMYQSLMPSTSGAGGVLTNSFSPYGFGCILLSDNEDLEDENNYFFKGNVIGWCPRTDQNAGTDTTRGVYNPTESYVKYEEGYYHAHLVYDFGTSQGNGEFSSIWWSPNVAAGSSYYKEAFPLPFKTASYSLNYRKQGYIYGNIRRNQYGELCKFDSSKYYKLLNTKNAINGIESPTYDVNPGEGGGNRSSLYAFNNGENYCSGSVTASTSSVRLATLKTWEITFRRKGKTDEDEAVKTYNMWETFPEVADCVQRAAKKYDYTTWYTYWKMADDDGVIYGYMQVGSDSSSYTTHPNIDSNGTITPDSARYGYYLFAYDCKNMAWKIKPSITFDSLYMPTVTTSIRSYSFTDKLKVGQDKYVCLTGSYHYFILDFRNMTCSQIYYERMWISGNSNYDTSLSCFGPYNTIIPYNNSTYGVKMVRGYNAHTKLPNKVTKTSADTMKIQYDYYIQMPYAFTDDDNYIPPLT